MRIDAEVGAQERLSKRFWNPKIFEALFRFISPRVRMCSFVLILVPGFAMKARAQEVIPAGTLLQCTLNEPNFSSATASVGDPVVCYLRSVQQFGHIVLPRGSYLQGHLAAEKEPGHFFGKGYLRLEFDRIGLPGADIPVPSKVISASGGYKSDPEGELLGKGHAKRDAAEWMFPPLWPWKMITLPARGPRPTLKGEKVLTLRLMDDVVVPNVADVRPALMPGWRYFGEPARHLVNRPQSHDSPRRQVEPEGPAAPQAERMTLVKLKSNEIFRVTSFRIRDGRLTYVLSGGATGSVGIDKVDWKVTSELNIARATTGTFVWRGY